MFFSGLALLLCHELDAVAQTEWRLLPILSLFDDEMGYTLFVALHAPLLAVLLWLTGNSEARIRLRSQQAVDAFLIIHVGLHLWYTDHALYTFHSLLSETFIFGGGAVGLAHLALTLRPAQA